MRQMATMPTTWRRPHPQCCCSGGTAVPADHPLRGLGVATDDLAVRERRDAAPRSHRMGRELRHGVRSSTSGWFVGLTMDRRPTTSHGRVRRVTIDLRSDRRQAHARAGRPEQLHVLQWAPISAAGVICRSTARAFHLRRPPEARRAVSVAYRPRAAATGNATHGRGRTGGGASEVLHGRGGCSIRCCRAASHAPQGRGFSIGRPRRHAGYHVSQRRRAG